MIKVFTDGLEKPKEEMLGGGEINTSIERLTLRPFKPVMQCWGKEPLLLISLKSTDIFIEKAWEYLLKATSSLAHVWKKPSIPGSDTHDQDRASSVIQSQPQWLVQRWTHDPVKAKESQSWDMLERLREKEKEIPVLLVGL